MKYEVVLGLLCMSIFACSPSDKSGLLPLSGTLRDYTGLDGCTWVIQMPDGSLLEPVNLGEFNIALTDNAPIVFTCDTVPLGSICMVGPVIQITSVIQKP